MVDIKFDRPQLNMMADFARQEMRDRARNPEDSGDVHLSKCWIAAMIRVVAKDKAELVVLTEINELKKVLDF